jgi:spore coat protein A, manganese oxidase
LNRCVKMCSRKDGGVEKDMTYHSKHSRLAGVHPVWLASAAAVAGLPISPAPAAAQLLDPTTLMKFVDPLPNPLANPIAPSGTMNGSPLYQVSIGQFQQQLHRDLPATTLWGYNNLYPGPTFIVNSGQKIHVQWTNNLVGSGGQPLNHLLPYDTTLHGAHAHLPQARIVTHLHGGVTEAASDGHPEHWYSPNPAAPANGMGGPAGNSYVTTYHNNQRAGNLWYHDHAMGITRLNVYAGMAGAYFIRDPHEQALNLPSGQYEIPLVLQDRQFYSDGRLHYPSEPHEPLPPGFPSEASIVPHFMGDVNLVNGKIWPQMEVEPRKYRFRMLNGANSRTYNLVLDDGGGPTTFHQIGTDVGLLAMRADRQQLLLGPADRSDVIVDFSQFQPGQTINLRNIGPDGPYGLDGGGPADPNTTGQVMQFKIVPPTAPDTSSLPTQLVPLTRYNEADAVVHRRLTLVQGTDDYGRPLMLLDGKMWEDPTSEISRLGDLEIWEIENFTRDSHPIHLHLAHMQILDKKHRQTGPIPLEPWELGWEDTVMINPRETVRLFVMFEQFLGEYVWHCHMLEHEDHEMMRRLNVIPEPASIAMAPLFAAAALLRRRRR